MQRKYRYMFEGVDEAGRVVFPEAAVEPPPSGRFVSSWFINFYALGSQQQGFDQITSGVLTRYDNYSAQEAWHLRGLFLNYTKNGGGSTFSGYFQEISHQNLVENYV